MNVKTTKIQVREDRAVSETTPMIGANIMAVAFNMDLIVKEDPKLAQRIFAVYKDACDLRSRDWDQE